MNGLPPILPPLIENFFQDLRLNVRTPTRSSLIPSPYQVSAKMGNFRRQQFSVLNGNIRNHYSYNSNNGYQRAVPDNNSIKIFPWAPLLYPVPNSIPGSSLFPKFQQRAFRYNYPQYYYKPENVYAVKLARVQSVNYVPEKELTMSVLKTNNFVGKTTTLVSIVSTSLSTSTTHISSTTTPVSITTNTLAPTSIISAQITTTPLSKCTQRQSQQIITTPIPTTSKVAPTTTMPVSTATTPVPTTTNLVPTSTTAFPTTTSPIPTTIILEPTVTITPVQTTTFPTSTTDTPALTNSAPISTITGPTISEVTDKRPDE